MTKKDSITSSQPNQSPKTGAMDGKATLVQIPEPGAVPAPSQTEPALELATVDPVQPGDEARPRSSSAAEGCEIPCGKLTEGQICQWLEWIDVNVVGIPCGHQNFR